MNTNKQVRFLMINEGISSSSQKKQVKTITNAASEVSSESNEDKNEKFVFKVLINIENNHKESFFNCVVEKGYCSKRSHLMPALHWNAMSEAASLRWTQQKTTKKHSNLHFGHETTVSERESCSGNEGCVECESHPFACK